MIGVEGGQGEEFRVKLWEGSGWWSWGGGGRRGVDRWTLEYCFVRDDRSQPKLDPEKVL